MSFDRMITVPEEGTIAPGLAPIRADLHSQAVELVRHPEIAARAEGGDGHDVAVLEHGSVAGRITHLVTGIEDRDIVGIEEFETESPLLEITADGIIDIGGRLVVLIEQDIAVIRDLFDPGIIGGLDAQLPFRHLGILPEIGLEPAFVPIFGMIVDDGLARVEAVDGMDDDVFRIRFLGFAGTQKDTGEAQGHDAAQDAFFHGVSFLSFGRVGRG